MSASRTGLGWDRPRRWCAALVCAATLVFGGLGGGWLMESLVADAARTSRQNTQVFGETVARTVAAQFDRALQYGIAIETIRGTDAYLQQLLVDTPGVTRIVLSGAEDRVIHRVGLASVPDEILATVPIVFQGQTLGRVQVGVAPRTLAAQTGTWQWLFLAAALGVAAAAAAWAAAGPGAQLERRRSRLLQGLQSPLSLATDPARPPPPTTPGRDPLAAALQTLAEGNDRVRAKRATFEALAAELLAVDFDDRQAPEIERLRQQMRQALDQGSP
jgi:hypothetical protein